MRKSSFLHLVILGVLALVSIALYLGYHLPNRWQYALTNRALSVTAIIVTGIAIALATMLFQTVVNNRILTPSILGVDSLYLLIALLFSVQKGITEYFLFIARRDCVWHVFWQSNDLYGSIN